MLTPTEREWLKGYISETRYIRSLAGLVNERPTQWARGKGTVKNLIRFWARPLCMTLGDAQKGIADAAMDSVN